jgi:SAM-dependent methyltransferase
VNDYPTPINAAAIEKYHVVAGYGKNIICPYCLSTARERLVLHMLEKYVDLTHKVVLHCSPEKKVYDYLNVHAAKLITADLHPGFYRNIDPHMMKQDLTQLDEKDETYDLVIANHVMEHIPNDSKALQEIYRVLKPGGQAVLQVPFSTQLTATIEQSVSGDPTSNSKNFGQKDHVRIYALHDYVSRLEATGFRVHMMKVGELSQAKTLALQEEEVFFMITKS